MGGDFNIRTETLEERGLRRKKGKENQGFNDK